MTVTSLFKTELLQNDKKKQDKIRKNWRWRLKWDKNWCKCILMWWSTDETRINLSHIWVKFEQDVWRVRWDKTHFNVMMHSETKIHLSHIWVKFKQDIWVRFRQDLNQIWAELKWWRLNLKFLTLTLRHHTWQYMWFFNDRIDKMIFIKHLLTIIQKMKRLLSRKVIFSINVILKQRWIIIFIMFEV